MLFKNYENAFRLRQNSIENPVLYFEYFEILYIYKIHNHFFYFRLDKY